MGGRELVQVYVNQQNSRLCDQPKQRVAENVYVTLFRGLTLEQYVKASLYYCRTQHSQSCKYARL